MGHKFFSTYSAAGQNKQSSPSFSVLIAVVISSSIFLAGIAHAQPSTDASALRLIGTVAGDITGAVLADSKGEQTFYRLHESLPDGSQIVEVHDDRILLRRTDGVQYELFIAHDKMTAVMQHEAPVGSHPTAPAIAPGASSDKKVSSRQRRRMRKSPAGEE